MRGGQATPRTGAGVLVGIVLVAFGSRIGGSSWNQSDADPFALVGPPLAAAPVSDVDFGANPALAQVLPQLESFVEESRGLRFKHSVVVTPLSDKAFLKQLHSGPGSKPDTSGSDATLQALHLLPTSYKKSAAAQDAVVGGFYDPPTQHLYIRGTTLNPLAQTTIVHELTHALDDQYVSLDHLENMAQDDDEFEAIESLIEGDARWVEDSFSDALASERHDDVDAEGAAEYGDGMQSEPYIVRLQSYFPYEYGADFVKALRDSGGSAAVNAAFEKPPLSTQQVIEPAGHYLQLVDPEEVTPPVTGGPTVVDKGTLGALVLASAVSEQSPRDWDSQPIVNWWTGDSYVTYRKDGNGPACVRDIIQTDPDNAQGLRDALTHWATTVNGVSVTLSSEASVVLVSCAG